MPVNKPTRVTGKTLLAAGVVLGGLLVLRRAWQAEQRHQRYDAAASGGTASPESLANEIRQTLNPSGLSWMMAFDTTDEAALFALAPRIKDFGAVSKAYRQLFRAELLEDLRNELSPAEYQAFTSAVGKASTTLARSNAAQQTSEDITRIAEEINALIEAWGAADTSRLFALAASVRDLAGLRRIYLSRYSRTLDDHLQSQWTFSASDYQTFIRLAST